MSTSSSPIFAYSPSLPVGPDFPSSNTSTTKCATPTESKERDLYYQLAGNQLHNHEALRIQPRYVPKQQIRSTRPVVVRLFCVAALLILVPAAALSVLIALVASHRVNKTPSIFPLPSTVNQNIPSRYIIMRYSATDLTNISSLLSTAAPFASALIMAMWTVPLALRLRRNSSGTNNSSTTTPDVQQFGLMIALQSAATWDLFSGLKMMWKTAMNHKSPIAPSLATSIVILFLSGILSISTFAADQWFHISTTPLIYNQTQESLSLQSMGKSLIDTCDSFNRTANEGLPCTADGGVPPAQFTMRQTDLMLLQNNASSLSEIVYLNTSSLDNSRLAILLPAATVLTGLSDFRATTIGVATQCRMMTSRCNPVDINDNTTYRSFNCSDNFYGVLGKLPVVNQDVWNKAVDPDTPPLSQKVSEAFEYGFFMDPDLNVPYNSLGLNPATGNTDNDILCMPDDELVNPVYMGFAGRLAYINSPFGGELDNSPSDFDKQNFSNIYLDFMMNCSYTTYDVTYDWVAGSIQSFNFTPTTNGSVAEMYHGIQYPYAIDGDPSQGLQDNLMLAAQQNTTDGFLRTWSDLYSNRVIATIGAYTDPALNVKEQTRNQILGTRIYVPALAFLLSCAGSYVLLGLTISVLTCFALREPGVLELAWKLDIRQQVENRFLYEHLVTEETLNLTPQTLRSGMGGSFNEKWSSTADGAEKQMEGYRVGVHGDDYRLILVRDDVVR